MTNSTLFDGADPTGLPTYITVDEGGDNFSVGFTVAKTGTLKRIRWYSPVLDVTGTSLPTDIGLWDASNDTTPLYHRASVTDWSGAESSGWVSADTDDITLNPGVLYLAEVSQPLGTIKQAYLYDAANAGGEVWMPRTSTDTNITSKRVYEDGDIVIGNSGPANMYLNSDEFGFPSQYAPGPLNWLIDVEIEFVAPGPLSVETTDFPAASLQLAYSETLEGDGGESPYTWAVTAGSLPAGLSLNASTGVISGTPTANGVADFTVTITDSDSATATADLSITVVTLLVASPTTSDGVSTYSVTAGINNTGDAGPQNVRVLPPDDPAAGRPHGFLWVLPVEPDQGTTYGDGIATMKTLGIHNTYNLTCIEASFPLDPWYIDNDTDPQTQQDSFMMALVAWAEANLATSHAEKHYLIGFSKSGFGGQELFWHHQDKFQAVASWDAAMDYQTMDSYDGADAIGSQDNLTANELYNPQLETWKAEGTTGTVLRIFLYAGINLVEATSDYADRLTADGIRNTYTYVEADSHAWAPNPGWVAPAVAAMLGNAPLINGVLGAVFI